MMMMMMNSTNLAQGTEQSSIRNRLTLDLRYFTPFRNEAAQRRVWLIVVEDCGKISHFLTHVKIREEVGRRVNAERKDRAYPTTEPVGTFDGRPLHNTITVLHEP